MDDTVTAQHYYRIQNTGEKGFLGNQLAMSSTLFGEAKKFKARQRNKGSPESCGGIAWREDTGEQGRKSIL